jgi:hypothetical protein
MLEAIVRRFDEPNEARTFEKGKFETNYESAALLPECPFSFSYRRVTRRFTRQLAQSTHCTQTIPRVALIGFLPLRIWVDDTVTGPSGFCFVGSME